MSNKYRSGFLLLLVSMLAITTTARQNPDQRKTENTGSNLPSSASDDQFRLIITVTDEQANPVMELKPENFAVLSDKAEQKIGYFSDRDEPVSVVVLVDTSGSMSTAQRAVTMFSFVKGAFSRFVKLSHEENDYALMSFDKVTKLQQAWTPDENAILAALGNLSTRPAKGGTCLYDACYQAMEMAKKGKHPKRAIILFSDGVESCEEYNKKKLELATRESGILVYTVNAIPQSLSEVGTIRRSPMSDLLAPRGDVNLLEIASASGGLHLSANSPIQMNAAFEAIAVVLRHQYVIGFKPPQPPVTGKWHQLKVRLVLPKAAPRELRGAKIYHRQGYYDMARK